MTKRAKPPHAYPPTKPAARPESSAQPDLAGKITGMLLEIENSELLHLIDNQEALNNKVNEAIVVLNEYNSGGQSVEQTPA